MLTPRPSPPHKNSEASRVLTPRLLQSAKAATLSTSHNQFGFEGAKIAALSASQKRPLWAFFVIFSQRFKIYVSGHNSGVMTIARK